MKNKKIKSFYNRMIKIPPEIKDLILSNYMELSRCRHCIIFAKWRIGQIDYDSAPKEGEQIDLDVSLSDNNAIDMEIDYLVKLHKFRAQKAQKIRSNLFLKVEPGILDLEVMSKPF
jgi:hypothetical protein